MIYYNNYMHNDIDYRLPPPQNSNHNTVELIIVVIIRCSYSNIMINYCTLSFPVIRYLIKCLFRKLKPIE